MNSATQQSMSRRHLRLTVVLITLLTITACGSEQQALPQATQSQAQTQQAQPLTLIAHRGAWRVYPESSVEAIQALADTHYPIEFDLRPLADGTLVPSHDPKADRTMQGVSGPLEELTLEQWDAARVRSQDGNSTGTPTTWERILDSHTPGTNLFPELKRPTPDLVSFIESIRKRNLQNAVVVQTFDLATAERLAAAGLQTLLLLLGDMPDPQHLHDQGIGYVGVSRDLPVGYIQELKDAGLTVYVYIINRIERLMPFLGLGIDGVFTDDPWRLEQQIIDEGVFHD